MGFGPRIVIGNLSNQWLYFAGGLALILNGVLVGAFFRRRRITTTLSLKGVIAAQIITGLLLVALGVILR